MSEFKRTKGKGVQGKVGKNAAISTRLEKQREYNERAKMLGKRIPSEGRQRLKLYLLQQEGYEMTIEQYKRLEKIQNRVSNFLNGRGGAEGLRLGILEKAEEIEADIYREQTIEQEKRKKKSKK